MAYIIGQLVKIGWAHFHEQTFFLTSSTLKDHCTPLRAKIILTLLPLTMTKIIYYYISPDGFGGTEGEECYEKKWEEYDVFIRLFYKIN